MKLGYMELSQICELFSNLREKLGDDTVLNEVSHYFNSDEIKGFCESIMTDYDIEPNEVGLENEEE